MKRTAPKGRNSRAIAPLRGFDDHRNPSPRALPWAITSRPFGAFGTASHTIIRVHCVTYADFSFNSHWTWARQASIIAAFRAVGHPLLHSFHPFCYGEPMSARFGRWIVGI